MLGSCDYSEKELPEEDYINFCIKLADEYSNGERNLSEYFDLQLFSDKVSGEMSKYLGRNFHIANGTNFAENVDTYIRGTDILIFNKLKKDKQGRTKAVFFATVSGYQNYMEMELSQSNRRIYIADLYDYVSGSYLSELTGQSMAVTNYRMTSGNKHTALSYDPLGIYQGLTASLAAQDVESGWKHYNQLHSEERKMKLFDFYRINLALGSSDSVYFKVLNDMLSEQKRDPRFFYIHRFDYFVRQQDYPKVVEQLNKLYEYTGKTSVELSQLGIYLVLAGDYQESFKVSKQLKKILVNSPIPEMQDLIAYYLMNDTAGFDKKLTAIDKIHSISGLALWVELTDNYTMIDTPAFDTMKAWILKNDSGTQQIAH